MSAQSADVRRASPGELLKIVLAFAHRLELEHAARSARPYECCGVLLGSQRDTALVARALLVLRNSDRRPGRFSISDAQIRYARLIAHEQDSELIAIAHSHADSPPIPSARDLATIRYATLPWLIGGFDEDDQFRLAAFTPPDAVGVAVTTT